MGAIEKAEAPLLGGSYGYNPALDGVRGLAILLVMVHHMTVLYTGTPADTLLRHVTGAGWVGVDLFFVLSGFLITGILCDSKASAKRSAASSGAKGYFVNFYMRRVLRIFPLYYAVVFLFLVVMPRVAPGQYESVEGQGAWYWLYASNFLFAREGRYIHGALDVSWSLAIEEQFYILWPLVVWACSRRALMRLGIAMMLACLAFRLWQTFAFGANHVAVYVLTPSRVDALAAGALLAVAARSAVEQGGAAAERMTKRLALMGGAAALFAGGIMVAEVFGPHHSFETGVTIGHTPWSQTVGLSLLSVAGVGLTAAAVRTGPRSVAGRVLGCRVLRTLGKYAYGLYLLHKPVRAILRAKLFGPAPLEPGARGPMFRFPKFAGSEIPGQMIFYVVAILATFGVAWISWQLFESQFLKLKRRFPGGGPSGS